jgi:hypothetical protein
MGRTTTRDCSRRADWFSPSFSAIVIIVVTVTIISIDTMRWSEGPEEVKVQDVYRRRRRSSNHLAGVVLKRGISNNNINNKSCPPFFPQRRCPSSLIAVDSFDHPCARLFFLIGLSVVHLGQATATTAGSTTGGPSLCSAWPCHGTPHRIERGTNHAACSTTNCKCVKVIHKTLYRRMVGGKAHSIIVIRQRRRRRP